MTTQQEDDLRSRTPTQWEQAGMDWWNAKTEGERGAMLSSPLVSEKSIRWMTPQLSPARCYEVFAANPKVASCTGSKGIDHVTQDFCDDTSCPVHYPTGQFEWDEDGDSELEPVEWCVECNLPIGVGSCGGCLAVASITPTLLPPYEG